MPVTAPWLRLSVPVRPGATGRDADADRWQPVEPVDPDDPDDPVVVVVVVVVVDVLAAATAAADGAGSTGSASASSPAAGRRTPGPAGPGGGSTARRQDHQAAVVAAEAERVRQDGRGLPRPRLAVHDVGS